MPVPILVAASPTTIPEKTFDKIWVEQIIVSAPDPNGDAFARVTVRKFGVFDGVAELSPEMFFLDVPGVLSGAATDPDLDLALSSLMTYVKKVGVAQGVIAPNVE